MEETVVVKEEQTPQEQAQEKVQVIEVQPKKRSGWKTLGIKVWFLLMVIYGIGLLAFVSLITLFIKPDFGFDINSSSSVANFLKDPNLFYWRAGSFTTSGIIASVLVGVEFILYLTTIILYKKMSFVIGKKGSFTSILSLILFFTICLFVIGMISKPDLITNLPGGQTWRWQSIIWEVNSSVQPNILEPTIVWWGTLIVSCVGAIAIVSLLIVFIIKFIFARSHDKE